jgi:hypothetical protein
MDDEGNKQDFDKDKGNIPNHIDEDVMGIPKNSIVDEIKDY